MNIQTNKYIGPYIEFRRKEGDRVSFYETASNLANVGSIRLEVDVTTPERIVISGRGDFCDADPVARFLIDHASEASTHYEKEHAWSRYEWCKEHATVESSNGFQTHEWLIGWQKFPDSWFCTMWKTLTVH